jgi:hypothetical protein
MNVYICSSSRENLFCGLFKMLSAHVTVATFFLGTEERKENRRQGTWCPGRDSNWTHPAYKSRDSTFTPECPGENADFTLTCKTTRTNPAPPILQSWGTRITRHRENRRYRIKRTPYSLNLTCTWLMYRLRGVATQNSTGLLPRRLVPTVHQLF